MGGTRVQETKANGAALSVAGREGGYWVVQSAEYCWPRALTREMGAERAQGDGGV